MQLPSIRKYLASIPEAMEKQDKLLCENALQSSIFKSRARTAIERLGDHPSLILLFADTANPGYLLWTTNHTFTNDKEVGKAIRLLSDTEGQVVVAPIQDWADSQVKTNYEIPAFEEIVALETAEEVEDQRFTRRKWSAYPFAIVPAELASNLLSMDKVCEMTAQDILFSLISILENNGCLQPDEIKRIPREVRDLIKFLFINVPDFPGSVMDSSKHFLESEMAPKWSSSLKHDQWLETVAEIRQEIMDNFIKSKKDEESNTKEASAGEATDTNIDSDPIETEGTKRSSDTSADDPSATSTEKKQKLSSFEQALIDTKKDIKDMQAVLWTLVKDNMESQRKVQEMNEKKEERRIKSETEKESKGWRKLQETTKTIYLTMCSDGNSIPTEPTQEFVKLLQGSSAADVCEFLKAEHMDLNMEVDKGLETALLHGSFASHPHTHSIENFSPFFLGPVKRINGHSVSTSEENRRLRVQSSTAGQGLSTSIVDIMIKQLKSVPVNTTEFMHHIKNTSALARTLCGESSKFYEGIKKLAQDLDRIQALLDEYFATTPYFGASLLERIHIQLQSFIHSCFSGRLDETRFDHLEFKFLLMQLETKSFNVVRPAWLKPEQTPKLGSNSNHRNQGKDQGGRKQSAFHKAHKAADDDREMELNRQLLEGLSLNSGETFGKVFSRKNKMGYPSRFPTTKDTVGKDIPICHRFHVAKKCHKGCPFVDSHKDLKADEHKEMNKLLDHCRSKMNNQG